MTTSSARPVVDLFGNRVVTPKLVERDRLAEAFVASLAGISADELVAMLYSRFEAVIDFARLCKGDRTGHKISMLFNPHRYATATKDSPSLVDGFRNPAFLDGLARAVLFKHNHVTPKELFYQVLQLGINGIQYVNEFPPHTARQLYLRYNAERILDPCAGWGGRMIGAASVGAFYHGFEPATQTYAGLRELGEFLRSFDTGFDYRLDCLPFEDAILTDQYDLAMTSPPYYDTELYSDEPTQSAMRYDGFARWAAGFYVPMVHKAMAASRTVVLNLGNRRYPMTATLEAAGFRLREISLRLSGIAGLGREKKGAEAFYELEGDNATSS